MPIYQYTCRLCSGRFAKATSISTYSTSSSEKCPDCGTTLNRVYTPPAIATPFAPHFNDSLGQYISSRGDLQSALSRLSDETSARTGTDASFSVADPREAAVDLGVTGDGLESTLRRQYDEQSRVGRSPSKEDNPTRWL